MNNVLFAFLLTLFAGLSTGIGGCLAFVGKKDNKKFLSVSLGFSAGVMIYVSMIEIFAKAKESLVSAIGFQKGNWLTVIAFFGGMILIATIDKFVPKEDNPHEFCSVDDIECQNRQKDKGLMKTGVVTAVAIGIHNFPEGLATFMSALQDPKIAVPIAVAIAIHNIPEGLSVSMPIYHATGSKKKAFLYALYSGLSEPIGALIGYVFLRNLFSELTLGIIFAGIAGIMVFISIDELLPASRAYGEHHLSIYGLVAGMMIMAVSLLMMM